jgi:hypothetical protein
MFPRSEKLDLHPTDEDLSVGTPAWGTRRAGFFVSPVSESRPGAPSVGLGNLTGTVATRRFLQKTRCWNWKIAMLSTRKAVRFEYLPRFPDRLS